MKSILTLFVLLFYQNLIAQNNTEFQIKYLKSNINTTTFGTAFYKGDTIIYTQQVRKLNNGKNLKKIARMQKLLKNEEKKGLRMRRRMKKKKSYFLRKDLDFYIGIINKHGDIIKTFPLNKNINTKFNEIDLTFSTNYKKVFFTRNSHRILNKGKKAIYMADVLSAGNWVNIKKLPFVSEQFSFQNPSLSVDNKTLYFSSNMFGSIGKHDIFKVAIHNNKFGVPVNLGTQINTTKDEITPFMLNNKLLYFSSNGKKGLGGLDIYKIDLSRNSNAILLAQPLNSKRDDLSFKIKRHFLNGYFVTNRLRDNAINDIYYFNEIIKEKPINKNLDKNEDLENKENIIAKENSIEENSNKQNNTQLNVLKNNVDEQNIIIENNNKQNINGQNETQNNTQQVYQQADIYKNNPSQINSNINLITSSSQRPVSVNNIIVENKAPINIEISSCYRDLYKLQNIYFDLNKSYIRADAARELDNVIALMRRCPNLNIKVTSHTDCRSSSIYNKKLSQRRAENSVRYILKNGHFMPNRLKAIGFGESDLINRCSDGVKCSELEHKANRRTQFEILNK